MTAETPRYCAECGELLPRAPGTRGPKPRYCRPCAAARKKAWRPSAGPPVCIARGRRRSGPRYSPPALALAYVTGRVAPPPG